MAIVMLGDIGVNESGQQQFLVRGSGFLVYNYSDPKDMPFLVTARHVFEPQPNRFLKSIRVRFPSEKPAPLTADFGYLLRLTEELPTEGMTPVWKGHPHHTSNNYIDIAAIKLDLVVDDYAKADVDVYWRSLGYSFFMYTDSLFESDMVMSLGYPGNVGYLHKIYHTHPVLRSGIVSWISQEQSANPISFLVDIPSYGGSSGGPVFFAPAMTRLARPNIMETAQPLCLGLVSRFVPEYSLSQDERKMLILQMGYNSGLTEVVPTEMIIETLELFGNPSTISKSE